MSDKVVSRAPESPSSPQAALGQLVDFGLKTVDEWWVMRNGEMAHVQVRSGLMSCGGDKLQ
jgi:hypothetical protein